MCFNYYFPLYISFVFFWNIFISVHAEGCKKNYVNRSFAKVITFDNKCYYGNYSPAVNLYHFWIHIWESGRLEWFMQGIFHPLEKTFYCSVKMSRALSRPKFVNQFCYWCFFYSAQCPTLRFIVMKHSWTEFTTFIIVHTHLCAKMARLCGWQWLNPRLFI